MANRFFLRNGPSDKWREVTQDEYIQAERVAGFHPKPGCGPFATAGFHGPNGVEGRLRYGEHFDLDRRLELVFEGREDPVSANVAATEIRARFTELEESCQALADLLLASKMRDGEVIDRMEDLARRSGRRAADLERIVRGAHEVASLAYETDRRAEFDGNRVNSAEALTVTQHLMDELEEVDRAPHANDKADAKVRLVLVEGAAREVVSYGAGIQYPESMMEPERPAISVPYMVLARLRELVEREDVE